MAVEAVPQTSINRIPVPSVPASTLDFAEYSLNVGRMYDLREHLRQSGVFVSGFNYRDSLALACEVENKCDMDAPCPNESVVVFDIEKGESSAEVKVRFGGELGNVTVEVDVALSTWNVSGVGPMSCSLRREKVSEITFNSEEMRIYNSQDCIIINRQGMVTDNIPSAVFASQN